MIKKVVFLLTIVFFTVRAPSVARAQAGVSSDNVVYDSDSQAAELRRLKTQYRGELEEYRRLEDQYMIAKQQYQQLGTLVSLETGIHATQAAMESRLRVLRTYLQILKVSLLQQTGIEVDQKEATLNALSSEIQKLTDQDDALNKTQLDKTNLEKESDNFEVFGHDVEEVSYHALTLLAIGKVQSVYDNAFLLTDDMKTQLATEGGALKQAQRQRGFDETQRQFAAIDPQLKKANQAVRDIQPGEDYKSLYERITKDLSDTYTGLSQTMSYLRELTTL